MITYLTVEKRRPWHIQIGIDVLEIPFKAFALQLSPQRSPLVHIDEVTTRVVVNALVEKPLVVVEPHFGQSNRVQEQVVDVVHGRSRVRSRLAVHVAHVTARRAHQLTTTHPDLERDLQILTTPDFHVRVEGSKRLKIAAMNSKQATLEMA